MADDTVTVEDLNGVEYEVPTGLDGKNPVSPNNPSIKAVPEAERDRAVEARKVEVEHAEGEAEAAGAGADAASTNKEDNSPAELVEDDKPRRGARKNEK